MSLAGAPVPLAVLSISLHPTPPAQPHTQSHCETQPFTLCNLSQAEHLLDFLLSLPSMQVSASSLVVLVPSLGQIAHCPVHLTSYNSTCTSSHAYSRHVPHAHTHTRYVPHTHTYARSQAEHLVDVLLSLPSMQVSASSLVVLVPSLGQIARARPRLMERIVPDLIQLTTDLPGFSFNNSQVCTCSACVSSYIYERE